MAEYVKEIDLAFKNDASIDELGVVLSDEKSVVVVEHKIGLSMNILKPLFKFCVPELEKLAKELNKLESIDCISAKTACSLSRAILLVKGDFPPALNMRKMLITRGIIDEQDELRLLNVVFSKHPKSPSAWYHRRWCIIRLLDSTGFSRDEMILKEIELCERMCDIYPRNYYSWNHRQWIVHLIENNLQLENEYGKMSSWLKKHVSDHSAVNHQIQVAVLLLHRVMNENVEKFCCYACDFMKNSMLDSMRLLHSVGLGGHESMWYQRRLFVLMLLNLMADNNKSQSLNRITVNHFGLRFGKVVYRDTTKNGDVMVYLADVQRKILFRMHDDFDTPVESYVGLSSHSSSGSAQVVSASFIEEELDLMPFLRDGVTYESSKTCESDDVKCSNDRDDECLDFDEIKASLNVHMCRLSSHFDRLRRLYDSSPYDSICSFDGTLFWLYQFVTEELLFCGTCVSTSGWYTSNCWDPRSQKTHALKYCSFLLNSVSRFLKDHSAQLPSGTIPFVDSLNTLKEFSLTSLTQSRIMK